MNFIRVTGHVLALFALLSSVNALVFAQSPSPNFTRMTLPAKLRGVHEIALTGSGTAVNPFETNVTVTFRSPSGVSKTVNAFYDGGSTWRARLYVTEFGVWSWTSASASDSSLNGKSGSFSAVDSPLPGILSRHKNTRIQWQTANGLTFINISDTAYNLFRNSETLWQEYIRDNVRQGITLIQADFPVTWTEIFSGSSRDRYNLAPFQVLDERLQWMLDNYPGVYVLLRILPNPSSYATDDNFWVTLTTSQKDALLKYQLARWAAFPQLLFLINDDTCCSNDTRCPSSSYPNNRALATYVGNYLDERSPWRHLLSWGGTRDSVNCFTNEPWLSFIELQLSWALAADEAAYPAYSNHHVFCSEDYYEVDPLNDNEPTSPAYFYRRLFWAWILSGGSASYGGRWQPVHPYHQTGSLTWTYSGQTISGQLRGLDSAPYIEPFLRTRGIDPALFILSDSLVSDLDGATGEGRVKAMRRAFEEFVIYHPNAAANGKNAAVAGRTARLRVDLSSATGTFQTEWFRARDGATQIGVSVGGGQSRELTAPWSGEDVALHLRKDVPRFSIPGTIEAENFLPGGEGVGYHDLTSGNSGGFYRPREDVDILPCSEGGFMVGSIQTGEWWEYAVNVLESGMYELSLRVSRGVSGNSALRVFVNGTDVTGNLFVPSTGAWQNWTNVKKSSIALSKGSAKIRLVAEGNEFNLNSFSLTRTGGSANPSPPSSLRVMP